MRSIKPVQSCGSMATLRLREWILKINQHVNFMYYTQRASRHLKSFNDWSDWITETDREPFLKSFKDWSDWLTETDRNRYNTKYHKHLFAWGETKTKHKHREKQQTNKTKKQNKTRHYASLLQLDEWWFIVLCSSLNKEFPSVLVYRKSPDFDVTTRVMRLRHETAM